MTEVAGKLNLTDTEWEQLLSAARTVRAANVRRAKLILTIEDGESRESIMRTLGAGLGRSIGEGLAGTYSPHPGRAPTRAR